MKKILFCLLFATTLVNVTIAQENPPKTSSFKYGILFNLGTDEISQDATHENYYMNATRFSSIAFGAFAQYKNISGELNFFDGYFAGELKYTLPNKITFIAGGNTYEGNLNIDMTNSYNQCDDIRIQSFYIGAGFHDYLGKNNRFKIELNAKIGELHTNNVSYTNQGYWYEHFEFYNDFPNRKYQKTISYRAKPSLIYGGDIGIELLPHPLLNQKSGFSIFTKLGFMYGRTEKIERSLEVEEWIPGNVVFREEYPEGEKFNTFTLNFQLGVKWYFKYK